MDDLKFSIVTPTLNMGRFIGQCISGVLAQDYENVEHIVVDGGSTDGTLEILEKNKHVKWTSGRDAGLSDALNKGIAMATGDIIGWCCADDYYLPGAFKVVSRALHANDDAGLVYGDYREIDEQGVPVCVRREIDFDLFILRFLHVNYIATPAAFWRRSLHQQKRQFNIEWHFAMDYEFILELALSRIRFLHVPALLADFRRHAGTKSSMKQRQRTEFEAIVWHYSVPFPRGPVPVRKALRTCLGALARGKRTARRVVGGHYYEQWGRS